MYRRWGMQWLWRKCRLGLTRPRMYLSVRLKNCMGLTRPWLYLTVQWKTSVPIIKMKWVKMPIIWGNKHYFVSGITKQLHLPCHLSCNMGENFDWDIDIDFCSATECAGVYCWANSCVPFEDTNSCRRAYDSFREAMSACTSVRWGEATRCCTGCTWILLGGYDCERGGTPPPKEGLNVVRVFTFGRVWVWACWQHPSNNR